MFRQMRKADRQISNEEAVILLEKCQYGVFSSINEDGFPYGVPLSYVYENGNIYFHCAKDGQKIDNISLNDRVSFCVVGNIENMPSRFSTKYESVISFGRALEVNEKEKTDALIALVAKYSKEYIPQGEQYINKGKDETKVYKIIIEHMTGKARK